MSEIPGCSAGVQRPVQRHHSPIISADVLSPQPQSRPSSGTQHNNNNNNNNTTNMSRVSAISCLLASNLATSLASVAVGLGQINPGEIVEFNSILFIHTSIPRKNIIVNDRQDFRIMITVSFLSKD